MTHLEQKIFEALVYLPYKDSGNKRVMAQAAAKVAIELAKKAYNQGLTDMSGRTFVPNGTFKQFIQDYE